MNALVAGERFHFRAQLGPPSPEAWRPLDQAVARWVRAHGGSELLAGTAGWASHAEGQGDSALALRGDRAGRHGMPLLSAAELEQLALEPMVARPSGSEAPIATPFVLDAGYFYLRRNYLHEVAVAARLQARRASDVAIACPVSAADLDDLFQGQADPGVQPQRDAVRQAVGRRLFVLTGGPGTGKTTTVLRMLLALGRDHAVRHGLAPVVRISAPTGKAAQRLGESLRQGGALLQSGRQPLPAAWRPHLQTALGAEAGTLHRLLGSHGHHGGFRHHAGNPLPADVVVVDEASMVDLAMLRSLLDALREDAVLVLVGDADQLTSVGTGSVLLDLVSAMESDGGDDLVRLRHCFRADTALVPINEAVRLGDPAAFAQAWADAGGARARRFAVATVPDLSRRLSAWARGLHAGLQAGGAFDAIARDDAGAIATALQVLKRQQLLCALREGDFGAERANHLLEEALRRRIPGFEGETWYPGRAVMVTRNDYANDLFNGDVGLCLGDADGKLRVWFEASSTTDAADPQPRSFAPGSLPSHQGAFAVTVHKSQGSEYDQVAVLLPPDAGNAILSRQLLYTALTRARSGVELWGSDEVLQAALAASVERSAALRQRLEAATGQAGP